VGSGHSSRSLADIFVPETVDDAVGADNPVRFIDAFVDKLDLAGGVRIDAKATGMPISAASWRRKTHVGKVFKYSVICGSTPELRIRPSVCATCHSRGYGR
jgi:hypothetical protein